MSQAAIDGELVTIAPQTSGEMIHAQPRPAALTDMRSFILSQPSEAIEAQLAEYDRRRQTWRSWLLSKLVEGVHYGYPPGCEPRYVSEGGAPCQRNDPVCYGVQTRDGITPLHQWQPKQSLYKAGADFIVELMNVREEYAADHESWEMLGKPAGVFVLRCRLFSRATGESIGEGLGARSITEKKMTNNAALKMAQKGAKVAAVINAWGLSDLFTQDVEDGDGPQPAKHNNPAPKPDAPKAQPRGQRISGDELKALIAEWKRDAAEMEIPSGEADFRQWVFKSTGTVSQSDAKKPEAWTRKDYDLCITKIRGDFQ